MWIKKFRFGNLHFENFLSLWPLSDYFAKFSSITISHSSLLKCRELHPHLLIVFLSNFSASCLILLSFSSSYFRRCISSFEDSEVLLLTLLFFPVFLDYRILIIINYLPLEIRVSKSSNDCVCHWDARCCPRLHVVSQS